MWHVFQLDAENSSKQLKVPSLLHCENLILDTLSEMFCPTVTALFGTSYPFCELSTTIISTKNFLM